MQSHSADNSGYPFLSYLYSLFNKPAAVTVELETKKKSRARKDFSENVTASIALPDVPKKLKHEKKEEAAANSFLPAVILSDPNMMAWLSPIYHYFGKTPVVEEKKAGANTDEMKAELKQELKTNSDPVNHIMSTLESKLQEHRKKMEALETELKKLKKPLPKAETKLSKADKLKRKEANQQKKAAKLGVEKQQQTITADMDVILAQKVDLVGDQIKEHAARRVDLFFYLLVAVYGKQVKIAKDHTGKQHGKGSKKFGTQACHSSLFPAVKLASLPRGCGLTPSVTELEITGTHFDDSLNSTVELPHIVNVFDHHLEWIEVAKYKCKPTSHVLECLEILNQCASGKIDPVEGMNQFLKVMQHFFQLFEVEHLNKQKAPHQAMQLVFEYEKEGTFQVANKDMTINFDYIYMMLRLKPEIIKKAQWVPTNYLQNYFLKDAFVNIQEEILASPEHKLGL